MRAENRCSSNVDGQEQYSCAFGLAVMIDEYVNMFISLLNKDLKLSHPRHW